MGTGEFRITRWSTDDLIGEHLVIDRADPEVWITDELIDGITKSWEPVIENGVPRGWTSQFGQMIYTDQGTALRIDGKNRSVTYRLDRYDREHCAWLARWPD